MKCDDDEKQKRLQAQKEAQKKMEAKLQSAKDARLKELQADTGEDMGTRGSELTQR